MSQVVDQSVGQSVSQSVESSVKKEMLKFLYHMVGGFMVDLKIFLSFAMPN